jgi:ATP/ADP translocase
MIQSLFIGIFNGTFYISSHTLFIGSFGGESIPMAYLISGGVGIILTLIYSKLQEKIKFASLAKSNLIFVAIITSLLAFSYFFMDKKVVDYSQFVLFGPLFILSIVSFWGVANRLYNLRQGKRLFGIIDAGMIFGIIISSISVPLIPYLTGYEISYESLLFVSFICTLVTVIIQFAISAKFNLDKKNEDEVESEEITVESGVKILFGNKYVFMMATFVGLSVLVAFFVQYSFMLVLEKKYTNEVDLGAFLGIFTTALMIFTFIIKAFVYSKLIKNYGLKICLVILPLIVGAFTIGAVIIGYAMGIDDINSSGFLFFFMLIALSKLLAQALKEGIELPSFKLLYQTLNKKIRFLVQAQIDGSVNEFSALFSGLCLVGLSALSFIGITEISVVMIIIIAIWLFIAFALYRSYKQSLASGLKSEDLINKRNYIIPISHSILNSIKESSNNIAPNLIISLHAIDPVLFEKEIDCINKSVNQKEVQEFLKDEVLKYPNINHLNLLESILSNPVDESIKQHCTALIDSINNQYKKVDYQKIISLSNSKNNEDRVLAALMIRSNYDPKFNTILLRLIKDPNLDVKIEVIKTCGILKKIEFSPIIIESLADDELYSTAYSALKELGEDALEYLGQSYFKSNVDDKVLVDVTELISFINSEEADKLLFGKLFTKNRLIMQKAAVGIKAKNIKPKTEKQSTDLTNLLNEQISIVAWNYAAFNAFQSYHPEMEVTLEALEDDIEFSKELLFSILSIVYDNNSVQIAKNNIETGNPDNISYAIEMLDLFVHEHLKPKLFPALDDSDLDDRVLLLEDYFPIETFRDENIFDLILNRDSNFISDWTKASVIFEMDLSGEISESFLAQLFNPKRIIRETSYYKMSLVNSELRDSIINRFSVDDKLELIHQVNRISQDRNSLIILSLLKFKEVIGNDSFKPMNWVSDISHIKSEIVTAADKPSLHDNSLNYILRNGDDKNVSCNIVNETFNGFIEKDKIISIGKSVFSKIASNHRLTDFLILNNKNSLIDNKNLF